MVTSICICHSLLQLPFYIEDKIHGFCECSGAEQQSVDSQLDLAGGERLILHDDRAAGGQDHDVQVLLLVMGFLVPLSHHLRVMGRNEGHLHVVPPLGLPLQQRVQNRLAGLLGRLVVATDHIVG